MHHFVDPQTGNPLNIVHRDISPHNIMISYDGYVKVIDFGIAKADMEREEKTKTGTLKGKVSYLAPEYIEGLKLDNRYDIFSLGITFWEKNLKICIYHSLLQPIQIQISEKLQR